MTRTTRTILATTAIAALTAGPLAAQSLGSDADADLGADAAQTLDGGAAATADLGLDATEDKPAAAGEMTGTMTAETDAETKPAPGAAMDGDAMATELAALEGGAVSTSDAVAIGTAEKISTDPQGRVVATVALDESLSLGADRIIVALDADAAATGDLQIAMDQTQLASAIQAGIQRNMETASEG